MFDSDCGRKFDFSSEPVCLHWKNSASHLLERLRMRANSARVPTECGCQSHPRYKAKVNFMIDCACRWHQGCTMESGDFGRSPFLGSASDKPVLARVKVDGDAGDKEQ